jgi:hypothetical protein
MLFARLQRGANRQGSTTKKCLPCALPINPIMKQAHRVKGVVAGVGSENDPICDFPDCRLNASRPGVRQSF